MVSERYTLVVNCKKVDVNIDPESDTTCKVFVDDLLMGRIVKIKQGSFKCEHLKSDNVFAGRTRNAAATAMVYWVAKRLP